MHIYAWQWILIGLYMYVCWFSVCFLCSASGGIPEQKVYQVFQEPLPPTPTSNSPMFNRKGWVVHVRTVECLRCEDCPTNVHFLVLAEEKKGITNRWSAWDMIVDLQVFTFLCLLGIKGKLLTSCLLQETLTCLFVRWFYWPKTAKGVYMFI